MKRQGVIYKAIYLLGVWALISSASSDAAKIKDVTFPETVTVAQERLELRGLAVLKWAMLFDVYAGAFYLPPNRAGSSWAEDIPKHLELSYFREIQARDFAVSSDQLLRENLPAEDYRHIEIRLRTLYELFQDVKPGDRYSLVYKSGTGTELRLNETTLGTIPGHDFAIAYFGIWIGENPINKKFRDRLLGMIE